MNRFSYVLSLCLGSLFLVTGVAQGNERTSRLMDLVDIQGVRSNQLVGYGLVVGLDGSGDKTRQTKFTTQSLTNMLRQLGVQLPEGIDPNLKNVAAVSVTASLPSFSRPGQKIDITVSSIGDAGSLKGGTLLMTPLKGVDGNIYALAQGSVVVSGISVDGNSGSSLTVNVPTVGRIPDGAIVEREVPGSFADGGNIVMTLRNPGFSTARNIAAAIDKRFGEGTAQALDNASITVQAPQDPDQRVAYMAMMESMPIVVEKPPARVVINSRTGTVVMNEYVGVLPAAVSHGNLVVNIRESSNVSQPEGILNQGQTAITPNTDITMEEGGSHLFVLPESTSLQSVVDSLNRVGATPSDLMAVLQALKSAGALKAELIVI
ncbi:flagellar basal body P-ring protein FlgI [Endozoicomonas ascidiicola]|uniref:flagellar basal body P-ring protein FlgI n=1 Tax=Endozoicomonas ascidiicola TaxID=1698521 RepID=UPI00082FC34D|nr:flagellar basal body P-ring protein FlgI [Endozoicomonas ascidiicola]